MLSLLLLKARLAQAEEPALSLQTSRRPIGEVPAPEASAPELGYWVGRALDGMGLPILAGLWMRPTLSDERFGPPAFVFLVRSGLETGDLVWLREAAVPEMPLPEDVVDTLALEAARAALQRRRPGDRSRAMALLATIPDDSPRAAAARVLEGLARALPARSGEPAQDLAGAVSSLAAALRLVHAADGTRVSPAEAAWADFFRGDSQSSLLRLGPLLNSEPDARQLQIILAFEAAAPFFPRCGGRFDPPPTRPIPEGAAYRALDAATGSLSSDAEGWLKSLEQGQIPAALDPWVEAMPEVERLRVRQAAIGLERAAVARLGRNAWRPVLEQALAELEQRTSAELEAATQEAMRRVQKRAADLASQSEIIRFESVDARRAYIDCDN